MSASPFGGDMMVTQERLTVDETLQTYAMGVKNKDKKEQFQQ
jgi:hypothetical protein